MPVREISFCVLDTETTGLDPKSDRLLSVSAIKVRNFQIHIKDRFEYFVKQDTYQPGESVKIHGILVSHSDNGFEELEVMQKLIDFIGNDIIVGHHIHFDWNMLNEAAKRHFGSRLLNQTLDSAVLAKRVISPFFYQLKLKGDFSLDALFREYNIPLEKRHTSSGDAMITALLFMKLLHKLEKKGINNLKSLLAT